MGRPTSSDSDVAESPTTESPSPPMRVGLGQFMNPTPEKLRFCRQLGVTDVLLNMYQYSPDYPHLPDDETPPLGDDGEWSEAELVALRERVEAEGLTLNAIENVPVSFYDKLMLGLPGKEEQLASMKRTVRNMGRAGIPTFGYHWMPSGVWRNTTVPVRGGATATGFDLAAVDDELTHDREYSEAELWENYEYFVRELVPVAEEAGVRLCLHPNDPPVESLGGVPQLFRSFEAFERAMNVVDSPNHGLEFCLGCWSEMGEDVIEVIRQFGERDKLFYVHFRDVEGSVPSFNETFLDEGNYDSVAVLRALLDVGFDGLVIPDHVPHVEGDTDWEHRGRAHAVGYLNGMLAVLDSERSGKE
ncbi:mannonate dehydratase [Halorarum halobium]|uniref:mannonate dehydratase n=1 Tax=Halorarum halobium TaxID=3075121 RepID=UPI0028AA1810|nr:mannonate dehydratase [Halobaculum sp. XH14]